MFRRSATFRSFHPSLLLRLATRSAKPLSPSEESVLASRGVMQEREVLLQDYDKARDESLRQKGAKVNSIRDLEFDDKIEEATGVKISPNNNLPFRIRVSKPLKPNMDEPSRVDVKPGQTFVDAVSEHLKLKEEADKKREELLARYQQKVIDFSKTKKKNKNKTSSSSSPCSSASGAFNHTRLNFSSVKSGGIPQAPPLPGNLNLRAPPLPSFSSSSSFSSYNNNNPNPTDDEICFHLRSGIEKSPSGEKDVTSLQLSLTEPMMNAIAERHSNSLRAFIQRFPARFNLDLTSNKVELIGVPKTPQQQQRSVNFGAPVHPSELKKQQQMVKEKERIANDKQQQQQQQQNQPQQQQQRVAKVQTPPPFSSVGNAKFAAPALPSLPNLTTAQGAGGAGGGASGGGGGGGGVFDSVTNSQQKQHMMETAFLSKTWKSPAQIVDELMEYIPSFWIPTRFVHNQLPFEIKELYQSKMRLNHFLKKFNFYFDAKLTPRGAEIKVRDDCKHPKKGAADEKYGTHLRQLEQRKEMEAEAMKNQQQQRIRASLSRKPRYVEVDAHSLAGQLKQLTSNQFQSIKDFQNSLPGTITSHPEYDASAGVVPTLEKHPFIFQVANDSVRLRPSGVAPNALDSKGKTEDDSPLPHIFAKVMRCLPAESYDDTAVEVSAILAKLNVEERDEIKKKFRSLPRFLRLHGAALEISRDNTTVRRWEEPNMGGAGSGSGGGASQAEQDEIDALNNNEDFEDPNEPQQISEGGLALPKAGKDIAEASNVQWALKELYSSLPLSTCVILDDAISMLPSQMRDAAAMCPNLVEEMEKYPDYFQVWKSPDDGKTLIVQRTMVGTPSDITMDDVVEHASKLIPQGGIEYEKLMRRMPPRLQRYLFRHGLKTTLKKRPQEFLVVGDKILYISERE